MEMPEDLYPNEYKSQTMFITHNTNRLHVAIEYN
jgi:hypothetical protein